MTSALTTLSTSNLRCPITRNSAHGYLIETDNDEKAWNEEDFDADNTDDAREGAYPG